MNNEQDIAALFANLGKSLDATVEQVKISTLQLVEGLKEDRKELEEKKKKVLA